MALAQYANAFALNLKGREHVIMLERSRSFQRMRCERVLRLITRLIWRDFITNMAVASLSLSGIFSSILGGDMSNHLGKVRSLSYSNKIRPWTRPCVAQTLSLWSEDGRGKTRTSFAKTD